MSDLSSATLPDLTELFNRRSRELFSLTGIVRQQSRECERYFELCGPDPTLPALETILTNRLSETESKVTERRRRVKELRSKIQELQECQHRRTELISEAQELRLSVDALRAQLARENENIAAKTKENSALASCVSSVKARKTELRVELGTRTQVFDSAKREVEELRERERQLQQQQSNLQNAIASSRSATKEAKAGIVSLANLEKEIEQLKRQLAQTGSATYVDSVYDPGDLDPVCTKQVNELAEKIDKLKIELIETRAKGDEAERRHKRLMSDHRGHLEEVRKRTNTLRKEMETNQCSIRTAVRTYTKELEDLQARHHEALRADEKCQDELTAARARADALLIESERELANLKDELARIVAAVDGQAAVNEKRREKHEKLRREVESLRAVSVKCDAELSERTNLVAGTVQKIARLKQKLGGEQEEFKAREADIARRVEELKEQIRMAEERLPATWVDEVGTSPMNESEVRKSVDNLEREYAKLTEELEGLREQVEQSERTRAKIEAAMDLITEMDDEEVCMTSELKMLRGQFAATIEMLKAQRKK
jgi:chromosome segregation ATPase